MKKYIICAILLMTLTTAAYCSIQDMHRAVLSKKSVESGFIGFVTARNDTLANRGTADGGWQEFTLAGSGIFQFSRMGFVPNNTDTAKTWAAAVYNQARDTLIATTGDQTVAINNNWNTASTTSAFQLTGGVTYAVCAGVLDDSDWQLMGEGTGTSSIYYDTSWNSAKATLDSTAEIAITADYAVFADNGQTGLS